MSSYGDHDCAELPRHQSYDPDGNFEGGFASPALPAADNDWIIWHGGECPVNARIRVDVRFRDGSEYAGSYASAWTWKHNGRNSPGGGGDIMSYRVCGRPAVKPAPETPKRPGIGQQNAADLLRSLGAKAMPVVTRISDHDQFLHEADKSYRDGWPVAEAPSHLPTDAKARKALPICTGVLDYFPDALAAVAEVSRIGNDQHNPGQPLHWAKGKSTDHADCAIRHFTERGTRDTDGGRHTAKAAWRVLAYLQMEIEAEKAGMSFDSYTAMLNQKEAA